MRSPTTTVTLWWLVGLAAAAISSAQPAVVLDLADVSPEDGTVRWLYGHTGFGNLGVPVAGGHDCDGDGFNDLAVGHFTANPLARTFAGEVYLSFGDGTTGGFVDSGVDDPDLLRIFGAGINEAAGSEIWMDDVTGDGVGDLLICRQNFRPDEARRGAGALTILAGGPELRAFAATLEAVDLQSPPEELTFTTIVGAGDLDRLCIWTRTGDITGDGINDIVVGADQEDSQAENSGALYVIRGGSHLMSGEVVDLQNFGATTFAGHLAKILPPPGSESYHLGATCQIADLDGNGRAEVLAAAALARAGASLRAEDAPVGSAVANGGAPDGEVYIAWDDNFPTGDWVAGYQFDISASPGSRTIVRGEDVNEVFGEEILGGRDYDGNGEPDLFIGDLLADGTGDRIVSGYGHVFFNAAELKDLEFDLDTPPIPLTITRIYGPEEGAIGADTAADGDFDGDGVDDLAFASPHANPQGRDVAGAFHVLFGSTGGWPEIIDLQPGSLPPLSEIWISEIQGAAGTSGSDDGDTLGYSAAAGDIDHDGRDDLIANEMIGNGVQPNTIDVGNLIAVSGTAIAGSRCSSPRTLGLEKPGKP